MAQIFWKLWCCMNVMWWIFTRGCWNILNQSAMYIYNRYSFCSPCIGGVRKGRHLHFEIFDPSLPHVTIWRPPPSPLEVTSFMDAPILVCIQDICSWYIVLLSSSSTASFLVACFDLSSTSSFQQFRRYYPPIRSHNLKSLQKKANSS